jgi:hypothetical protein
LFPTFQYSEEVKLSFVGIETLTVAMGREEKDKGFSDRLADGMTNMIAIGKGAKLRTNTVHLGVIRRSPKVRCEQRYLSTRRRKWPYLLRTRTNSPTFCSEDSATGNFWQSFAVRHTQPQLISHRIYYVR